MYFFVFILLTSCVKDEFDAGKLSKKPAITPNIATPIGYTTFSLERFIGNNRFEGHLKVDKDSFLTFVYNGDLLSATASEYIFLQDAAAPFSFVNNSANSIDLNTIKHPLRIKDSVLIELQLNVNTTDAILDSIEFLSAEFLFDIKSDIVNKSNIVVSIPALRSTGTIYNRTMLVNSLNIYSDLKNHTIELINNGETQNGFWLYTEIVLPRQDAVISPDERIISGMLELNDMLYNTMYGYIGKQEIEIPVENIDFDLYNAVIDGYFHFSYPTVVLNIANSFGVPTKLLFNKFNVISGTKNVAVSGTSNVLTSGEMINYPSIDEVGYSKRDTIRILADGINLGSALDIAPYNISVGTIATLNPAGNNSYNFIKHNSCYKVDVELQLPVWGYTNNLIMNDTLDFDYSQLIGYETNELKAITFEICTTNSFPANIGIQLFFSDKNYQLLSSLSENEIIIEGATETNENNKPIAVKNDAIMVSIEQDKIEQLYNTRYIIVQGKFKTVGVDDSPPANQKFYLSQYLDAQIGVIFSLDIK